MQHKQNKKTNKTPQHNTTHHHTMLSTAAALMWVGPNWSRTLIVPTLIIHRMFAIGQKVPAVSEDIDEDDRFDTWNQFVNCFESELNQNSETVNALLDICFDEIGKMIGCSEDYVEFSPGCFTLATLPPGLAITHWYTRGQA